MIHWLEGWSFERMNDGKVKIVRRETSDPDSKMLLEANIPPADWAKIVAGVSHRPTAEAILEASHLHDGPTPP